MDVPHLTLKCIPPRPHRVSLARARLERIWEEINDRAVIAVVAPRGFGKSTLLVQWRRLWLERGVLVAWLTLDAQDDASSFAKGVLQSLRAATGRSSFDALAAHLATQSLGELDALTALLAAIANVATPTVLILDDGEQLADAVVRLQLAYLMHNAPPNLRVVIGTCIPLPLPTWDLAAHDNFAAVTANDLRFELEESIAILQKRFGARIALNDCVRLHEIAEGWPIGLQLAAASIERADDLHVAIQSLSARSGDLERYFMGSLFARLPEAEAEFLIRIAILDDIHPELCEAVTGTGSATTFLGQLIANTPILIVGETRDWTRLHPLVRDFLLARFEKLPADDRRGMHRRAAEWLAGQERFHTAGRHALAAGDQTLAYSYAQRSLWTLLIEGKLAEARGWLDELPDEAIAGDIHLSLIAAWIMSLSDRPAEALPIARRVLRARGTSEVIQFEAALVASCAAAMCDRLGMIPQLLARWPEPPEKLNLPAHIAAYANTRAIVALHHGATETVRQLEARMPALPNGGSSSLAIGLGQMLIGLSHLYDGNACKAEAALRPALIQAERAAGRRSVAACLLAAPLAAAMFDRDQLADARSLLANRLDVIERTGLPDAIMLAYQVLAGAAAAGNDERHALAVLDQLFVLGEAKQLPRLVLTAIVEQIRIHALRSRTETLRGLMTRLDSLATVFRGPDYRPLLPEYQLSVSIAKVYAALAESDLAAADKHLKRADALAAGTRRREGLRILVLRAVVARQQGSDRSLALLSEALDLAKISGIDRLLVDVHPQAVAMAAELRTRRPGHAMSSTDPVETTQPMPTSPSRGALPTAGLLTPKEAEVLGLLNTGLSNKLIAKTLDISEETVKWHLKNLFAKLSAGTRRHAVDRARLFGLVGV